MGSITNTIEVKRNGNLINNPYYMPPAAQYMNDNKFNKIALFSRLSIGERDCVTNQTAEGGFSVAKNHPIETSKRPPLHVYVESEMKYEQIIHQHYVKECQEYYRRQMKNALDSTRKSKIVLTKREIEIHEQFDEYIRICFNGIYARDKIKDDYYHYYKNAKNIAIMTKNKISDLRSRNKIGLRDNYIGFVEEWLNARLNKA